MFKKILVLLLLIITPSSLLLFSTWNQSRALEIAGDEVYYNDKGLNYFNEGFYKLTPKGKTQEAAQKYEQAIAAFKEAIAINEDYSEAYLNLARVYYVQKKFSEAAQAYKRVTELNPSDIDAYVKLASAYARMQQYAAAIEQLEKAKTFAADEVVVYQLNDFINKLKQQQ